MSGFEPFFLAAATGVQVLGHIADSNATTAIAGANAAADEKRAQEERAVAHHQAEERRRQGRRLVSEQQARFASSGGGLGGSAAHVMADTAGRGELNSELELWQGETRARGMEDKAAITRASARANRRALPLKIAGTILTGASKVSSTWGGGSDPYGSSSPNRRWRFDEDDTANSSWGPYYAPA